MTLLDLPTSARSLGNWDDRPASDPPPRQMTEAQFLALPDARVEFIDGEAHFMSPVSLPHAGLVGWLHAYGLHLVRRSNSGRVFLDSVTVRLSPRRSRVPDLSYVAHAGPATLTHTYIDGPPNLIIEVVSPESRDRDYREKFLDYQSAGVQEYWIVDPTYQTIDAHRLVNAEYIPLPPTKPARSPPRSSPASS